MKLILREESGAELELEDIESTVGSGDLIVFLKHLERPETIEKLESYLSKKFGRNVIVLDARVSRIVQIN